MAGGSFRPSKIKEQAECIVVRLPLGRTASAAYEKAHRRAGAPKLNTGGGGTNKEIRKSSCKISLRNSSFGKDIKENCGGNESSRARIGPDF